MSDLPPLSLYIHFPWCVKKCPYCDFNSHVAKKDLPQAQYINTLLKDLENDYAYIQEREIQSIYLGGGTPSLFSGECIHHLLQQIRERVNLQTYVEITLEANPESVAPDKLNYYQQAGINRISLGIQSLHDDFLERLGRAHNSDIAYQAIETVITQGFDNFNIDLMYGLPNQSTQAGLVDIQSALTYKPKHLSWYQLTLEPHTAFFKRPPILPCDDMIMDLQTQGLQALAQSGLVQYEIAAFSQPGFECYHNNNYWTFGDYLGIGAGAHSKVTLADSNTRLRYSKSSSPAHYLSGTLRDNYQQITSQQLPFEFMLNSLRRYQSVDAGLFEARTGLPWQSLFPIFEKAASKELVKWDDNQLAVTPLGRRFYNDLVTLFL